MAAQQPQSLCGTCRKNYQGVCPWGSGPVEEGRPEYLAVCSCYDIRKTVELKDYRRKGREQAWYKVVIFYSMPHDSPSTSTEGEEVARFKGLGDAYAYAYTLLDRPTIKAAWAVIIR